MVQFNEIQITPDGTQLIVDVSIIDSILYEQVYLGSIIIDNQETFVDSGPSTKPIYSIDINKDNPQQKHYRLTLSSKDINLSNDLLFVYVTVQGIPDPSTPCGLDNYATMQVICNLHELFHVFMGHIREVEQNCEIPKGFINDILRFNALRLALSTGNYMLAIDYWNKFFKDKVSSQSVICRCNV